MNGKVVLFAVLTVLLAACSSQSTSQKPNAFGTAVPNQVAPNQPGKPPAQEPSTSTSGGPQLSVVLVPSELALGQNRFAIGLIDPKKGMIRDAIVHLTYYDLTNPAAPTVESEADATRLETPDGESTIYANEREFKRAGSWGVQVAAKLSEGTNFVKRIGFQVVSNSPTLKPGMHVPALNTRTAAEVGSDLRRLTSATSPNPAFYQQTLAQAITNGKPTVLLFATPAFCQTRFCGPAYDIVSEAQRHHGDSVNFVHVEVYTGLPNPASNNWQVDPAMTAFGLETEPWVFLIDSKGTIVYRLESLITLDEIERHLTPLLGG